MKLILNIMLLLRVVAFASVLICFWLFVDHAIEHGARNTIDIFINGPEADKND